MKRPTGVSVIAVYFLVVGILSLLWSLFVLGVGGVSAFFGSIFGAENITAFGGAQAWSGYVGLFTAVIQIALCFGLSAMKKWAWYLTIIGIGLTVFTGVIGMFSGGLFGFICGSIGLIIPLIILLYMLSREVRSVFGMI